MDDYIMPIILSIWLALLVLPASMFFILLESVIVAIVAISGIALSVAGIRSMYDVALDYERIKRKQKKRRKNEVVRELYSAGILEDDELDDAVEYAVKEDRDLETSKN